MAPVLAPGLAQFSDDLRVVGSGDHRAAQRHLAAARGEPHGHGHFYQHLRLGWQVMAQIGRVRC